MIETPEQRALQTYTERELVSIVAEILEQKNYVIRRLQRRQGWDLVAYGEDNRSLGVEVQAGGGWLSSTELDQALSLVDGRRASVDTVLFVTTRELSSQARARLAELRVRETLQVWDPEELERQLGEAPPDSESGPQFGKLVRLELYDVRGYRDFELDFGDHGSSAVIIGRNGTGKSTLLRAISATLAPLPDAAALLAHPIGSLVREGAPLARILADVRTPDGDVHSCELQIVPDGTTFRSGGKSGFFVAGYGTGRNTTRGSQPSPYRVRNAVASLFNYDTHLADPESVLRRLKDHVGEDRYERAMQGLRRVLGLTAEHRIELAKGGGVRVSGPGVGGDIPLEGWADGYRMTFQWLIDFYGWAVQADALRDDGGVNGILLVDELEQHLHPSMQAALLSSLAEILPGTQIIGTTHSPLVALGAQDATLVALHRDEHETYRAELPDLTGYSAEDVLMEETLFGTDPFGPKTRRLLTEQRRLASIPRAERSPVESERLMELARDLGPANQPQRRDDRVLERLEEIEALIESEQAGE